MKKATIALTLLVIIVLIPTVLAHAPLGVQDNENIDSATVIPDPTKSWALYYALNSDGDPQYYTFNATAGERIHVILLKSMEDNITAFMPMMAILGPELANQGTLPDKVTLPDGYNWYVIPSGEPIATYEPFSPSSFYGLSDAALNAPANGTYYVVVYENASSPTGGHYGLAIGDKETYTIDEWILLPIDLLNIYTWEGQTLPVILSPMLATVTVGMVLTAWYLLKRGRAGSVFAWVGAAAGLILIGSGANTLLQMLVANYGAFGGAELLITLTFVLLPITLGAIALSISLRNSNRANVIKRVALVVIGVVALFVLAGLFVGPILAIAAAFMPTRLARLSSTQ